MTTSSATTFNVSGVEVGCIEDCEKDGTDGTKTSICSQLKQFVKNHCTEMLMETEFPPSVRPSRNNGFVNTVIDCYNNHYNLVIRPDDIWTAILTQFSFYINKNAEEFRSQFVNFEDKKLLTVCIPGTLYSAPYNYFVAEMTKLIDENIVDKTLKEWILPNFTTTTGNDIISCGVIFMATTKQYFEYECCFKCGIPNVTLEGTVGDWEEILRRTEKLKTYNLDKWFDLLQPILKEFVGVKMNSPNIDFWNRICHYTGHGSGPTYLCGWLTAFAAFDENGNWALKTAKRNEWEKPLTLSNGNIADTPKEYLRIDVSRIPSGIVTVDVKISDTNGDHASILFAGHVAHDVLKDNNTLQPQIGWGIALKLATEEVEKYHQAEIAKDLCRCGFCDEDLEPFEEFET